MSSDDYKQLRQIGKGAFGTAHIVEHKVTGERFVLKRVRLARQSAKERQCSVRELLLLSNLRHRNVLDFKGCWVEGGCNLCLLVELCESGDLFTQIKLRAQSGVHFSEEHLQEMAVQLLSAVAYLHRSSIAHRDLKSSNVLITGEGCLKLADFGLSTVLHDDGTGQLLTKTVVGTPNYMSPCVLQEKPYGMPNDIWGLGCVLYEVSALKPAFQAFNMAGLIKRVTTGAAPAMPTCYSENWRGLIRCMLTKEPELRPSAAQLLELDWLQPAVRRVAARFGQELPQGAPGHISELEDLPAEIMGLFDQFASQEREEKRRAEEERAKRKAAVAKWDPMARAAAAAATAAATPKLPPLKPHQPRKPPPKPARGPGGVGPVPPLQSRAAAGSPINGANPGAGAAAAGRVMRRKTYHGEGQAAAAATAASLPGAHTASGGARAAAAGAVAAPRARPGVGAGGAGSSSGRFVRPPPVVPQPEPLPANGGSFRLQGGRPSSAPPDSPIRRPVAAAPPGACRESTDDENSDLSDTDDSFHLLELRGGADGGLGLVPAGTSIDGGTRDGARDEPGGAGASSGAGGHVGRSDCSVSSQQHPHDLSGSDFDLLERAAPSHTSQSPPGASVLMLGGGSRKGEGGGSVARSGGLAGSGGATGLAAVDMGGVPGQWATPSGQERGEHEDDGRARAEEQEATFRHFMEVSWASADGKPTAAVAGPPASASKGVSSPGVGSGGGFAGFIASAAGGDGGNGGPGVRASHPAPAAGGGVRRSSSEGTGPPRPQSSGAPRPPVARSGTDAAGCRTGTPGATAATAATAGVVAPHVGGSGMKPPLAPPAVPRPPSGSRVRTPSPGTARAATSAAASTPPPVARTGSKPAR
ncbi:hypothetical protein HYH02_000353 [Chlamydomonas schloesseri]|uniref:non-specific serine/threonine protein kinase n=1 Tax=Chlamydomonas schloesseri TaxID=2026947 RepID=A0A836BCK0_9CHLO|nr:hypothetical protein HYH02_000353 [Chlamydomonas schloesseri]|eukprot:KAG2454506.1 hypothetical protein HYH02_000353 [Chlamydomonas schloesseri]